MTVASRNDERLRERADNWVVETRALCERIRREGGETDLAAQLAESLEYAAQLVEQRLKGQALTLFGGMFDRPKPWR